MTNLPENSMISSQKLDKKASDEATMRWNQSITRGAFQDANLPLSEKENLLINSKPQSRWPKELRKRHDQTSLKGGVSEVGN